MPAWVWVIIVLAVIAVIVLVALSVRRRRTLQSRFGPEYDRTVSEAGSKRAATSELRQRAQRRKKMNIVALSPAARDRYSQQWEGVQMRFVDSPGASVREADLLVSIVMNDRGYPMEEFEQRSADVSVDYPHVVENYRAAHGISLANQEGKANTEDLRQAMVHYRSLFLELLGESAAPEGSAEQAQRQDLERGRDRRVS